MISMKHPVPSPSPSSSLHIPVHVSSSLVISVVVVACVLGLLLGVGARAARQINRRSEGASWGKLTAGQDLAVVMLSLVVMSTMAFLLPFMLFMITSVVIGAACVLFVVVQLAGAGPLVRKWERSGDGETWKELH